MSDISLSESAPATSASAPAPPRPPLPTEPPPVQPASAPQSSPAPAPAAPLQPRELTAEQRADLAHLSQQVTPERAPRHPRKPRRAPAGGHCKHMPASDCVLQTSSVCPRMLLILGKHCSVLR